MAILQVNSTQVASLQQSGVDKNDFLAGGFSRPDRRSETDLWSLRIKWGHSCGRFYFAAFASLRLGENRRLNKEAHLSQRRKGAKAKSFISQKPLDSCDGQAKVCPTPKEKPIEESNG
jgi:hypothetical protein